MEEDKENMILEYVSDQIKIQPDPERFRILVADYLLVTVKDKDKTTFVFFPIEEGNKIYLKPELINTKKYFYFIGSNNLPHDEFIPFIEKALDLISLYKREFIRLTKTIKKNNTYFFSKQELTIENKENIVKIIKEPYFYLFEDKLSFKWRIYFLCKGYKTYETIVVSSDELETTVNSILAK